MGMSIDELKKECQYCCREIDNSGLEDFICMNGNAIKARDSILCDPKNANEPCSICEYCKPGEEPAKQQKMDISECITWLKILRANMNTFPEISAEKKIEALTMAIKALEQEPCCNCIQFKRYSKEMGFEIEEEPKSEWQKDHEILKAYSDGVNEVLDKIRVEIVELTKCPYGTECLGANCPSNTDCMICGDHVLEIIDKYKSERSRKMEPFKITAEMNLKNLILELREVAQAINECADKLVMIDIKYSKEQEDGNE